MHWVIANAQYRVAIAALFESNPTGMIMTKPFVAVGIKSVMPGADIAEVSEQTFRALMDEFGVYDQGLGAALSSCSSAPRRPRVRLVFAPLICDPIAGAWSLVGMVLSSSRAEERSRRQCQREREPERRRGRRRCTCARLFVVNCVNRRPADWRS